MITISTRPLNSTRRERDDIADQLYRQLKEDIVRGIRRPGEVLPTVAQLHEGLFISQTTIMTAYKALAADKLVSANRSLGTTVIGPTPEAIADVAEELLESAIVAVRRLGISEKDAKHVFERVWTRFFEHRKGDRRGEIRTMVSVEDDRRAGQERRKVPR